MAQIKKPQVRAAILKSATKLFSRKGYTRTSLAEIAAGAGISTTNLYVYYHSKLEIVYAIYDPWMRGRFARIEREMMGKKSTRSKLRYLLAALWRDIPGEKNGFVNNIMQAISSTTPSDRFQPTVLEWKVSEINRMLRGVLPRERWRALAQAKIGLLLLLAFDGFILYNHVEPKTPLNDRTLNAICSVLLGDGAKR